MLQMRTCRECNPIYDGNRFNCKERVTCFEEMIMGVTSFIPTASQITTNQTYPQILGTPAVATIHRPSFVVK